MIPSSPLQILDLVLVLLLAFLFLCLSPPLSLSLSLMTFRLMRPMSHPNESSVFSFLFFFLLFLPLRPHEEEGEPG